MPVPTTIRHTDAGAPQLTGEDGSLRAILKWALPQLGWSEEFDDGATEQTVFRNDSIEGSGEYLKIYDRAADHGADSRFCSFESFETMTDINTGTEPIGGTSHYARKSLTADATVRDYYVIGDNQTFYLFINSTNASGLSRFQGYMFGDIASFKPADPSKFVMLCTQETRDGWYYSVFSPPVDTMRYQKIRYGINDLVPYDLRLLAPIAEGVAVTASGATGDVTMLANGGIGIACRDVIQDMTGATEHLNYRGRLRGSFVPLNNILENGNEDTIISGVNTPLGARDVLQIDGAGYPASPFSSSYNFAMLMDVSGDWNDY